MYSEILINTLTKHYDSSKDMNYCKQKLEEMMEFARTLGGLIPSEYTFTAQDAADALVFALCPEYNDRAPSHNYGFPEI